MKILSLCFLALISTSAYAQTRSYEPMRLGTENSLRNIDGPQRGATENFRQRLRYNQYPVFEPGLGGGGTGGNVVLGSAPADELERVYTWPIIPDKCTAAAEAASATFGKAKLENGRLPANLQSTEAEYRKECFAKDSRSSIGKADVENTVGIFRIDNEPFCTGFLVDKATVQTAMHCFYSKEKGYPERATRLKDVRFNLLSDLNGPGYALSGAQMDDRSARSVRAKYIADGVDQIRVSLSAQITHGKPIGMRTPTDKDRFSLVGLYSYSRSARWQDDVLWASGQSCRLKWTNNECIYHGCQSTPGYSGAPLLVKAADGSISAAGMHIAGPSVEGGCPYIREIAENNANVAVVVGGK